MDTEINEMNLNSNNLVVMSNDLIKSKSNLSLNEVKLLRICIMQVIKEAKDFQTYRVNITDLAKLLNIDRHGIYQTIDDMTTHLLKEVVCIGDGNPKHKWLKFQWVSRCKYNNGVLEIRLHDDLKPYILGLSKYYTQYILKDVLLLKSVYSIRLYELIRQEMRYEVFGGRTADVYLSLDTIKKATDTETKYEKLSMFRARVIDSSLAEIKNRIGYNITYDLKKESRKVIGFNFHIESNNNISPK